MIANRLLSPWGRRDFLLNSPGHSPPAGQPVRSPGPYRLSPQAGTTLMVRPPQSRNSLSLTGRGLAKGANAAANVGLASRRRGLDASHFTRPTRREGEGKGDGDGGGGRCGRDGGCNAAVICWACWVLLYLAGCTRWGHGLCCTTITLCCSYAPYASIKHSTCIAQVSTVPRN